MSFSFLICSPKDVKETHVHYTDLYYRTYTGKNENETG